MLSIDQDRSVVGPRIPRAGQTAALTLLVLIAVMLVALGALVATTHTGSPASHGVGSAERLARAYGRLPLRFEANRGQSDPRVRFLAHGAGYGLFFTSQGAVFALRDSTRARSEEVVRLDLVGADAQPRIEGIDGLAGSVNYLLGSGSSRWRTGIPTFARVRYSEAWPRVSVDFYGSGSQLEYDLRLAPGANPDKIALRFAGARTLRLSRAGALVVGLSHGSLRQPRPVAYQPLGAHRRPVSASYVLGRDHRVALRLGAYDHRRPLVVDPRLVYSTYLGGKGNEFRGHVELPTIAVDTAGNAYVTGHTTSPDFPTTPGAFERRRRGVENAFIAKLNSAGNALVYSTYLAPGVAHGIAVDASGNAYVTGSAASSKFPTTPGALVPQCGEFSTFVTKVNPTGSALAYSTCLGGGSSFALGGIAVDSAGDAYVTGETGGALFITPGAFQTRPAGGGEAFVAKLNPAGSALVYATFLGGRRGDAGHGIAVDTAGDAYVTGATHSTNFPTTDHAFQKSLRGTANVFVAKLNPAGSALVYSTLLRGHGGLYDEGDSIAVDSRGDAYVTGLEEEHDFPTTRGAYRRDSRGGDSAFVTKLNRTGSALVYSTLAKTLALGGHGIALSASGEAYVIGACACVAKLNAAGSALVYSTVFGSVTSFADGGGIAIDSTGNAYVTGSVRRHFRTTRGALQTRYGGGENDTFVAKVSPRQARVR